jgi:DNA-binding XRE family transcriptional regulator
MATITATGLKKALIEQGRTGSWLARELGVTPATVSCWVTGRANPSDTTKVKISALLGEDIITLFFSDLMEAK